MRAFNCAASSKFTGLPTFISDNEVRDKVCTITSAVNPVLDIEVAVKQTPLTATESPSFISLISAGELILKTADVSPLVIAVTDPNSAINPVNIIHHS